ncbi:MAG TPA: beta-galactosidase [Clostridiaceae bacterium]|nr:beta-galactosidase [Clostridiaceae bacterium]
MILGVDYYPEHWDKEMIPEDMARMRKMGVNTIRIGEFAWHMMEREEGEFDFSYFDHVLEKAREFGLKVIFGTPTATFPAWLSTKYPEVHSCDIHGHVRVFGGRRQYCFNSDKYRELTVRIVEKLVTHYRDEEILTTWQIDNEFGHEGSDMCYCEKCQEAFTTYLEKEYGDVDSLNETYGTIFWGQTYNSFREVPLPKETITVHNPALVLDHFRFRDASIGSFAALQAETVRKFKGEHQEVTHNFPGGFFEKAYDFNSVAKHIDVVSYDNYPVWGGLREPLPPAQIAMAHDYMRGLKDKNFYIVEQLMGAQGHDIIGYLPRPGQSIMWSYQALAHGCSDMLFFRWRAMNKGQEQFCLGIIDHNNTEGRKYEEVSGFFHEIEEYDRLLHEGFNGEVAVVYDPDNIWSWSVQRQSKAFSFTKELMRLYTPFHTRNVTMDVIPFGRDFSRYKAILMPVTQLITKEYAKKLEEYAAAGGTIIFSYRAGIKDRSNNLILGQVFPGYLKDLTGIEIHESESLQEGQETSVTDGKGSEGLCDTWRDLVDIRDAEAVYVYSDKFYRDKACVTRNSFGSGKVYYIGAGVDEGIMDRVVDEVITHQKIGALETPHGLEAVGRTLDGVKYLFLMNHTSEAITWKQWELEAYGSRIVRL